MTDTVSKLLGQWSPSQIGASEAFLLVSSAVISGLGITALHHWADVPVPMAILAVLGCFSVLVAGNAVMRRVNTATVVDEEIAELRAEIAVLRSARSSSHLGTGTAVPVGLTPEEPLRPAFSAGAPVIFASATDGRPTALLPAPHHVARREEPPAAERPALLVTEPSSPGVAVARPDAAHRTGAQPRADGPTGQPMSGRPAGSGYAAPATRTVEPRRGAEPSSARPDRSSAPRPVPPVPAQPRETGNHGRPNPDRRPAAHSAAPAGPATRGQASSAIGLDLDAMQALIEQFAAQRQQAAEENPLPPGIPSATVGRLPAGGPPTGLSVAGNTRDRPARKTLASLRARLGGRGHLRAARAGASPSPAADTSLFGHIALISEALQAKRMEAFLAPLVGLGDRKVRHVELSVRLITQAGHAYAEEELHRIAPGTGLLARIDAAKLARAVGVLMRFAANGSRTCLFCGIAGESLVDDNFAGAFSGILQRPPGQDQRLVLAAAQAEVRNFTAAHWGSIKQLGKAGAAFALVEVTDLDMDFEMLKGHGFEFIKLDASVFLGGLPTPTGRVPAADICRHLAGLGLNLVLGETTAE